MSVQMAKVPPQAYSSRPPPKHNLKLVSWQDGTSGGHTQAVGRHLARLLNRSRGLQRELLPSTHVSGCNRLSEGTVLSQQRVFVSVYVAVVMVGLVAWLLIVEQPWKWAAVQTHPVR